MDSQETVAVVEFEHAKVFLVSEDGSAPKLKYAHSVKIKAEYDPEGMTVQLCDSTDAPLQSFLVTKKVESARVGSRGIVFHLEGETLMISLPDAAESRKFTTMVAQIRNNTAVSFFDQRTEESSATQYFQFYGYLSQQQNMMQDFVRTSTYQKAILSNLTDFRDKVVLDVGAGSGILSFFAQQAGAKKVYAVEGSSIAKHAESLVKSNRVDSVIQVISGKIEEIELPEKVDMIISEPMGYMLLNERMLETYLHAKKWLKPEGGKMFPSRGDLHIAPFTDEALYMEQVNKVNFWYQDFFHGVNLSSLRKAAMDEYFRQPIVDTFDVRICLAKTQRYVIDFATAHETDLHKIEIPLEFHMLTSGTVHGLAFWFDVAFIGTGATVWLSTAPTEPLTHWYQVRCLLKQPIFAKAGQVLTGRVLMVANAKQSYDVTIECMIMGQTTKSTNSLDLKNPYFRYTGVQPPPPPGENNQSPSEAYWGQVDMQGARQAVNLVNGMIVDGLGHVSLDSTTGTGSAGHGNNAPMPQANIHQGSIPATGRVKDKLPTSVTMSAANSLQFNQLIGGGISPSVINSQNQNGSSNNGGSNCNSSSSNATTSQVMSPTSQQQQVNSNLMIGDYVHGNMSNVLTSPYRQH